MITTKNCMLAMAFLATSGLVSSASADTLRLALAGEHQSVDPHFSRTSPNQNTASNIFETLVSVDEKMQMGPMLATSWQNINPTTWEIELKQGVTFHDGSTFDAADVISSVERIPNVEDSPSSFISLVSSIASIEALDAHKLKVTTKEPAPDFMEQIGGVYIIPSELGVTIKSADFDSGQATIGTGPYKFVSWTPNESLVLKANEQYWGEVPGYSDVIIRYIPNAASRVATLMAGDVDAIDQVPPSDVAVVKARDGLEVSSSISGRLIYLHLDSDREQTPFIKGSEGGEINNPLRDKRVRKALSLLIDRNRIVEHIMDGRAVPAGQMVPEGFIGFNPEIKTPAYDLEGAKALLTEAGYPDGFSLTIHGPNDRYVNDAKVIQALSQLFARGGLKSSVEAMPKSIYFKSASKREFSVFLVGFGTTSGNSSRGLEQVLSSYNKEAGIGTFNRGRFSNPAFDDVMTRATATFDDDEKEQLLKEAATIGFVEEQGILPLYFEELIWAHSNKVAYKIGPVERTLAADFRPVD
ncbi:ABC transporter substrate-binding protein [Kiloniella laminariae]|uniref:ABC transporter substrate-binding protein n=1 Tax=Kiloniella laminariae TaxID=454162 RepID=A0ABT4LPI3_9PROT|nr:ABC transporter substrate-binding protein [Kiloniella laminariae]MCZ4283033.1 ABC transporter substrate-binding protein [Kiloniella laminariae]